MAGAQGAAFWKDVTVDGTHLRVFTFAYGPDAAVQVARPLTEVDQSLDRIGLVPAPDRSRRHRHCGRPRARRRARRADAGPRAHETVERVSETQDLSERIDVVGQRRAQPARGELQHDARGARGVDARAAAARRGRVARAPNAAHERAHEHRGPRRRPHACRPRIARRLLSDVVEQLGEMTTLISELIELARAEQTTRRARGRPARPPRRGCGRAGSPQPA